jgi:hypothetical protein
MRARLVPLLAATAVMLAWAPASAQNGKPDTPSPGATAPSANITDQKLDAAAAALQRVVSLQKEYRERLAQTPDASAQQQLIAQANSELAKAVTDQGLSVEEYSSIIQVAQNDPEVRGKLLQRIDPAAGSK